MGHPVYFSRVSSVISCPVSGNRSSLVLDSHSKIQKYIDHDYYCFDQDHLFYCQSQNDLVDLC